MRPIWVVKGSRLVATEDNAIDIDKLGFYLLDDAQQVAELGLFRR